ncbi:MULTISPECIES: magnesium transporter MgtE N-terminal domain-containing protein [Dactylosporangium]|uniref:Magnesium transporter n=2 Tax=Dactylosporangium TaxID=35753 RepID=A0A9W6NKK2_9ACTN|nr:MULTISPECIES: CBS domain-containing protein [Dactylosporangium]UAB97346.1 magnesium transporter [Dactylosporangium vinaceum]UWZ45628.1 magnesium transporter [Dactylosporangium matsuzakiense]GLL00359.1 magnesium transporter [Dactylosporangium matsuzakiense]
MSTAPRVYIARLAGLSVFDPNGDQVGRVRDAVARMRAGTQPPRVVGLVAEMPMRRRIFLPIGRITAIEPDAVVLNTGTLNLRRFEKRPGELLVLEDFMDRHVSVAATGRTGAVVDVAMDADRTGEWSLSRVAVREFTGRLTRRGHLNQLEWSEVTGLAGESQTQGTAGILAVLDNMRAADLANVLQDLSESRRVEVATALDDERLADVLEELPEHDQLEIITALEPQRAADVLEEMDPDDAADLLAEMPKPEQEVLLDLMEPDEASPVRALLEYAPGTAGAVMTSEPIVMAPDNTVAEALARIREPQLSPAVAAGVFVTRPPMATPTGRYLGVVHFQRLLREPPSALLGGVVDNDIDPLAPDLTLAEITRRMATYNLVVMPVVDDNDKLVGAVTVDDVLDHLLPDDWRDRDHAETLNIAIPGSAGGTRG